MTSECKRCNLKVNAGSIRVEGPDVRQVTFRCPECMVQWTEWYRGNNGDV